jgi:superfamily I DNA/RNA helicase
MTRVTKILGTAGAGKSTTAREEIVNELANGTEPRETCICSFTRAAVSDIREGVEEAVNSEKGLPLHFADEVSVLTFNALCLRAAREGGFEDSELIALDKKRDEEAFQAFFESEMPQFEFSTPNPDDFEFDTTGAKMVAAYNNIRALGCTEIEDFARQSQGMNLGCTRPEFLQFVKRWGEWKRETGNRQHADYVQYVRERELVPRRRDGGDYRVLVIDEFQDLSPHQYSVYKLWRDSGEFDRIIIAGDAAQSIYGFRGANPVYLIRTPADKVIELSESHRCAPEVMKYANKLIAGEGYYESKLSSARDDDIPGTVEENYRVDGLKGVIPLVKAYVEESGSVFLLARRNKDVTKLARVLTEGGIPHTSVSPAGADKHEGLWYWDYPLNSLLVLFRNWARGLPVSPKRVESFLKNTTLENEYTYRVNVGVTKILQEDEAAPQPTENGKLPPEVMAYMTGFQTVRQALDALDLEEKRVEALRNALNANAESPPTQVRIGTIHSSKGLTADSCILFGDTTATRLKTLNKGGEEFREEKRLYFVGVTRARGGVSIVSGLFGSERSPVLA